MNRSKFLNILGLASLNLSMNTLNDLKKLTLDLMNSNNLNEFRENNEELIEKLWWIINEAVASYVTSDWDAEV